MVFQNTKLKPVIRHPQGHPVAVVAAFNTVGDFVPRYFRIEDDNSELFKYQISSIKAVKDRHLVKTFYCTCDVNDQRNDVVLICDITKHQWVLG